MKLITHPKMLEQLAADYYPGGSLDDWPQRLELLVNSRPSLLRGIERIGKGLTDEQVVVAPDGEQYLELFHSRLYIDQVRNVCEGLREGEIISLHDEREAWFSRQSYTAACYAVGAAVEAARNAVKGEKSFALVRPPGHHAHANAEGGFCLFNNIAIATEYLRQQQEKVLIVDIDLHLGDGTLSYVQRKPKTFYFSLNLHNGWPHLNPGNTENSKNIFLPAGTDDEQYIPILQHNLHEVLQRFQPSVVAVSAGFDTHYKDREQFEQELQGGMNLTSRSYNALWDLLNANGVAYFAVLEGGYDPQSVKAGVMSFMKRNG